MEESLHCVIHLAALLLAMDLLVVLDRLLKAFLRTVHNHLLLLDHVYLSIELVEADLKALCQSNSAQVQSFASKLHETNEEHQQLHTAHETATAQGQALRAAHQYEQQAAQSVNEYENMIQELRRQADEQPDIQKLLWKKQLSQQSTYRAEIHELHTEMLNMKEKSEMKSHLDRAQVELSTPNQGMF